MRILKYQHYERINEQTDKRTNEAKFIGPLPLKPWVQQGYNQGDALDNA